MIGIVILNYKNWDDTLRCIKSISVNPPKEDYTIILVDNTSDNQPDYDLNQVIKDYNIVYVASLENKGYNGGNNLGIQRALALDCDSILISNNDVVYKPGAIRTLYEYAFSHERVGIVGPKVLDINGVVQKDNICRRTGLREKYLVRTKLNKIFRKEHDSYFGLNQDYDSIYQVYSVLGCCFLMTADCAKMVTPLDEHPFLYEEELILGIKMEQAGFITVYNPNAVIVHLHGGSTKNVRAFAFAHNIRSEIYYCKEYLQAKRWQILPLYWYRVGLYLIRSVKSQDFRKQWKWFRRMTKEELRA